jgi:hypothetical protein
MFTIYIYADKIKLLLINKTYCITHTTQIYFFEQDKTMFTINEDA